MSERSFSTTADILAFAVAREIEAAATYSRIAAKAATPGLRELAKDLRGQEIEHRRVLEGMTPNALGDPGAPLPPDLRIVDDLAAGPVSAGMSIQDMLIFAAKREAASVALYESLARLAGPSGQERVFLFLAGQEREHKLRVEAAYEAHILPEN